MGQPSQSGFSRLQRPDKFGQNSNRDSVRIVPSGRNTTIKSIVTQDGKLSEAVAGQSVTLTFNDEVDCSRGDVVALTESPAPPGIGLRPRWCGCRRNPGLRRGYWLKIGTQIVRPLSSHLNINYQHEHLAAKTLDLNAIGVCTF